MAAEPPLLQLIVGADAPPPASASPTRDQLAWLRGGLDQPGGKLPLFDAEGKQVADALVRVCIARGWAEPWFGNPLKPGWLVCKLTGSGRQIARIEEVTP